MSKSNGGKKYKNDDYNPPKKRWTVKQGGPTGRRNQMRNLMIDVLEIYEKDDWPRELWMEFLCLNDSMQATQNKSNRRGPDPTEVEIEILKKAFRKDWQGDAEAADAGMAELESNLVNEEDLT